METPHTRRNNPAGSFYLSVKLTSVRFGEMFKLHGEWLGVTLQHLGGDSVHAPKYFGVVAVISCYWLLKESPAFKLVPTVSDYSTGDGWRVAG